ncbi:MAG: hypothetical protein J6O71_06530 [Lachnospiraceae bacterium]|nr:hypothetical protein [Lachnospiraceae bacterium]
MDQHIKKPSPTDVIRFNNAKNQVINEERHRSGIGTLAEKTTHRIIKRYLEGNTRFHEVPLGDYIADVYNGSHIYEIQTRNFGSLKNKLSIFLTIAPVTVVYPVSVNKSLVWIEPESGEVMQKRLSGKHGRITDIFKELVFIKDYLDSENLSFRLLFFESTDYRLLNGYGRDKKKHATKLDNVPEELLGEVELTGRSDFAAFLPDSLPDEFSTEDFRLCSGTDKRIAGKEVNVLKSLGLIERCGSRGKAYLYRRSE